MFIVIKIQSLKHLKPVRIFWLVNRLVENTPFNTFKNLAEIVKNNKYKDAKLIYNSDGIAYTIKYVNP